MKFSYNWIRELVPGLEQDPRELMRLITMKTAECEGLEMTGERWNQRRSRVAGGLEGSHSDSWEGNRPLRHEDGGLRRANCPDADRYLPMIIGSGERWDARERPGARHQSRSQRHR